MRVLWCALALFLLIGCSHQPVASVKTEYVVIAPDQNKLQDAAIAQPPVPQLYAEQTDPKEKERMLFEWGQQLTQSLGEVNLRLKSIRADIANAKAVYEDRVK